MKILDLKDKRAMIIAADSDPESPRQKENVELVNSSGAIPVLVEVQKLNKINSKTYFGSGKLEYFANVANEMNIDLVVVCEDLSPSQLENVKDIFDCAVIDRFGLILELFNERATTSFGKLQVKLATLLYMYPRLRGMRKDMDRQYGVVGMRGGGEQKLELDRRELRRRIDRIRAEIKAAKIVEDTKSKRRVESRLPIISLIGYSNTGKSTLLNKILEISEVDDSKKVYADDRLFATLDTHARKIKLPNGSEAIITDTVGLISNLPHQLIDAFTSTLSEIKKADLLVQVFDMSNKSLDMELSTTEELIEELGIGDKTVLKVYNKADKVENPHIYADADLVISAFNEDDVKKTLVAIEEKLFGRATTETKFFSFNEQKILSEFLDTHIVLKTEYVDDGTIVEYRNFGDSY